VGATFQVPVVLSGGIDVASVPLQLHYDPAKLSLVNVVAGDLLEPRRSGVALIHRDDGPGNSASVAARPPGIPGVNGSGIVCVLTFQAKAAWRERPRHHPRGSRSTAPRSSCLPSRHADLNQVGEAATMSLTPTSSSNLPGQP
jgi:hypothetical protein